MSTDTGMTTPTPPHPHTPTLRILPDELRWFARQVMEKTGLPPGDAGWLAGILVESDVRGVLSHGTRQLRRYTRELREGGLNPEPRVEVVQEAPATALVDGDGGLGYFAARRATEIAIAKAKEAGTATVVARNHGHIGAAGVYARMALPHGCAALCTSGVDVRSHFPRKRPTPAHILWAGAGGPISFAIPAGEEPPLVLDMGCYIANMRDRLEDVFPLAPDAFFKIAGLGAVTMALGGILAGVSRLPEIPERRYPMANQGTFLAVFDLARFMPLEEFLHEMDEYVRRARRMEPLPGCDEAELPGGPEWRREREWAVEGIPLGDRHHDALVEVSQDLGVELPALSVGVWEPGGMGDGSGWGW